jgi:hypothetical protein
MKVLDFILAALCIAFLVVSYFVDSPEMKTVFTVFATICAVTIGTRAGVRMKDKDK